MRQGTTSAYIALQVANQALLNEQQAYATDLRLRDLTRKQFELEAAPEADAIRAEIALTQEEQNLLTAVGNVKQARANLNAELGRPPDTPVDTADPLTFAPVTGRTGPPAAAGRANAPRTAIQSGQERELAATVKMQRSQYYPDLLLGTDAAIPFGAAGAYRAPLRLWRPFGAAVRKAREDVRAQQAQTEQTRQQVRLQVQNAYDALEQARKAVLLYESKETGILTRSESLLAAHPAGVQPGSQHDFGPDYRPGHPAPGAQQLLHGHRQLSAGPGANRKRDRAATADYVAIESYYDVV